MKTILKPLHQWLFNSYLRAPDSDVTECKQEAEDNNRLR